MRKFFLTTAALFFLLAGFSIYQYFKFNDNKLHLIFCNVGQGDGILIRTPNGTDIIQDGGPDDSVLTCLSRHTPFWDRDIELMLLSHPHADHMTGMISIFQDYKVKNFATEALTNTTQIYNKLVQTLKEKNITAKILYAGDSFRISDQVRLKILGPTRELIAKTPNGIIKESSEDGSLMTLITFSDFNAILSADSPLEEIHEALETTTGKIEVFQIPHHGSKFNIDEDSITRVSPKLAVISVGKNKYGHPAPEVVKILRDLDIKHLRTDQHGDIEIIIDKTGQFKVN